MIRDFSSDIVAHVPSPYEAIGIIYGHNGCCEGEPYILTANECDVWPGGINYSCECSCGCWCTTGHGTIADAIEDYEEMTRRSKR